MKIVDPIILNDGTSNHTLKPVNVNGGIAQFTALSSVNPGVFDFLSIATTGQPGANHKVKCELRFPETQTLPDGSKVTYVDLVKIEVNRHRMTTEANGLKLRNATIDLLSEPVVVASVDAREHVW